MAALITFTVNATTFNPVITLINGSTATATWTITAGGSGNTTGLAPSITGLTAPATITLGVAQGATDKLATDLLTLDLGFDHTVDAGTYSIGAGFDHATQQVTAISGLNQATAMTIFACMNSPLAQAMDFTGMSALQFIECFGSHITAVTLTGCSSLIRLNIEQNYLTTLDLNPVRTTLKDLRAAAQNGNNSLAFATLSGPMAVEYHFCVRDQFVANPPTAAQLPAVQQYWIWGANQNGAMVLPASSGILNSVLATGDLVPSPNNLTSADMTNLFPGGIGASCDLSANCLASVTLTGCPGLSNGMNLHDNCLSTPAVDAILATVDGFGTSNGGVLNLTQNRPPSPAGQAHVTALQGRGWTVQTETVTSAARVAGVLGDNFHRANATGLAAVGNGWFTPGSAAANISGNTLARTDGGSYQAILNTGGDLLPPDYTVYMTFPSATWGNFLGLIGRWRTNGNCVSAIWSSGGMNSLNTLWIGQGRSLQPGPRATITPINAIPASWANNTGTQHSMAMQMQGSTITVFVDGVAIAYATIPINATMNGQNHGTAYGICGDGMTNRVYYSIGTYSRNGALAGAA